MTERVGVLGGTFDPIHNAHLVAATSARHALGLDRVVLVVAGDPWQKRGTVVAAAADRLAMTQAAVDGIDGLEVSAAEIDRPGPTYTIDTLRAMTAPDRELFLIVGRDVAARLDSWHEADAVRAAAVVVVVSRAPVDPDGPQPPDEPHSSDEPDNDLESDPRARAVGIPRLDIASSDIRRRVQGGEPIDGLVPPAVVRVIRERRLYTRS